MDRTRKARGPVRALFTKACNSVMTAAAADNSNLDVVQLQMAKLEALQEELVSLDRQLCELFLEDGNYSEEGYAAERSTIEDYRDKLYAARLKATQVHPIVEVTASSSSSTPTSTATYQVAPPPKRKFRLPELKLKEFGGEVHEWLGFWGQFRKIDEDMDIEPEDKFQYLIQATVTGSRARELVDSYPPTAANYPLVIEGLKSRFGRDDLQVEVYVRELLKLVIQNVSGSKAKLGLSFLYDKLESHLRSLKTIGVTSDQCSALLFPLVESCLPEEILRAWQRNSTMRIPEQTHANRLEELLGFLKNEVEGEARISLARTGFGSSGAHGHAKGKKSTETTATATDLFSGVQRETDNKKPPCVFCEKSNHESKECYSAQKMTLGQKRTVLSSKKCCFACLRSGHLSKSCKSSVKCLNCGRRHWVLMCPEIPSNKEETQVRPSESQNSDSSQAIQPRTGLLSNQSHSPQVVLQTLMVKLTGNGTTRTIRAIVDTGSQSSYILEKTAADMGYSPLATETIIHKLFGGIESKRQVHHRYEVTLSSMRADYYCRLQVLDQRVICGEIPRLKSGPWLQELKTNGIWIEDIGEGSPEIQMLIGADVAGKLLTGNIHQLKSGLVAVETRLGWTIMGKVPGESRSSGEDSALMAISLLTQDSSVADLWELDAIGITDPAEVKTRKELEAAAMQHFCETVKINAEGRYEIELPWIEGHAPLDDNRAMAEKRLLTTTKKLRDLGKFDEYNLVFEDWLKDGVIEEIPAQEFESFGHYLPHRGVFKNNSTTTCRPVFDASARTKNYPSLNDCVEKGPNLIELIPSILTRFREKNVGVVSDIRKAFLQISVKKSDSDFLRFLWWSSDGNLKAFRHRRVVFGVNCSPFLLGAVITYHLGTAPPELRPSADQLAKSFYIDNCVTSVDDEENLYKFIQDGRELMRGAMFDLRGWEHTVLRGSDMQLEPTSVLGLLWDRESDQLWLDIKMPEEFDGVVTKRNILSITNKVFDPLGFACPVMLCPRMLLQESWQLKIGWDTELPEQVRNKFQNWVNELSTLSGMKIPRQLSSLDSRRDSWSLHTFCDASKSAYAAVVFLRSSREGEVNIQLIQAKSRVAPLKKTTIPRLELLACSIGSRLAASVTEGLDSSGVMQYFWSDSSTALSWISNDDQWAVFVHNRVKEIRTLTNPGAWRYIPSELNPADLPSRGCSVKTLLDSRWWEGPTWLKRSEEDWPKSRPHANEEEVNSEKKKGVLSSMMSTTGDEKFYLRYFSRYSKIVRMFAWVLRFAYNARRAIGQRIRGELTLPELDVAERRLLKIVQQESFDDGVNRELRTLGVFYDSEGLVRVKTKIVRRDDDLDFRCPILLPSSHVLVEYLVREQHLRTCHAGVQVLLSNLREKFWILRGRKTISGVVTRCVRCRRFDSKKVTTVPVPLPEDRVREASTFEVTGVDLAGPLHLKDGTKAWILLATCAVYRAVHLELITSLSTDAFIQGLRRFIARRGRPSIIYCDNGTNFVGAANALDSLDWKKIMMDTTLTKINWRFIPPTAAWWGGWWERIVRMVKQLLRRVLGRASLHYEELMTILCDCEAVINSRPLTFVSEDMSDLSPLTPAMFLQEVKETGVADLDSLDSVNLRRRFTYRKRLREDLRKRFRTEYLGQLVQREREKGVHRELTVGDVVLVGSDNSKRMDWPLARVVAVYPGKDNHVRVVRVKTASGELVRPIQRIYPLEVSSCEKTISRENIKCVPVTEIPQPIYTKSGRRVKAPERLTLFAESFIL